MTSAVTIDNVARHADPRSMQSYAHEEGLWPIEATLVGEFMPKPPARILDIGCGTGRTTAGLVGAGYEPVAIDLSDAMLDAARLRHPALTFERMDAAALGFASEAFDGALFSFNGIDYVYPAAARVACMCEVYRVLRRGGVFIFSSHNAIGHLFSGGYLYARGYVNAARMLGRQWRNPHLRYWYFRYEDFAGSQYFFSAPPDRSVAQLRTVGFDVLSVCGSAGERRPSRIRYREAHVYFVGRKPIR